MPGESHENANEWIIQHNLGLIYMVDPFSNQIEVNWLYTPEIFAVKI